MPLASVIRWRLQPFLARSVGFGPVWLPPRRARRELLSTTARSRFNQPRWPRSDQGHMGRLPDARAGPLGEAAVAGTARAPAQFRRQGLPAKAFPEDKDDAVEAPAVRDTAPPSLGGGDVLGQQWGQGIPQFVGHPRFH